MAKIPVIVSFLFVIAIVKCHPWHTHTTTTIKPPTTTTTETSTTTSTSKPEQEIETETETDIGPKSQGIAWKLYQFMYYIQNGYDTIDVGIKALNRHHRHNTAEINRLRNVVDGLDIPKSLTIRELVRRQDAMYTILQETLDKLDRLNETITHHLELVRRQDAMYTILQETLDKLEKVNETLMLVPTAVRNLHVATSADNYVILKWLKPLHPNGDVLGYDIGYQTMTDPHIQNISRAIVNPNTLNVKIKGLKPRTKYKFYIWARTGAGRGDPAHVYFVTKNTECDTNWVEYDRRCYLFHKCVRQCSPRSGQDYCAEFGAKLTQVHSLSHQRFLQSQLPGKDMFVGGNDGEVEGEWRWPNGDYIRDGYRNWKSGEPNGGTRMNCMFIHSSAKDWRDVECHRQYHDSFVCEKDK